MKSVNTADEYFSSQTSWRSVLLRFREILQKTELEETIKWGGPVYTLAGKNVVGIGVFKSYVGLWFYQGVFLSDPYKVLVSGSEGKTRVLRQLRFTTEEDVDYDMVRSYVAEAIANQKAGKEIKPEKAKVFTIPDELAQVLANDEELKTCFESLTPFKQREYAEYIAEPARPETRLTRLKKVIPLIMEKVGMNDKYRK